MQGTLQASGCPAWKLSNTGSTVVGGGDTVQVAQCLGRGEGAVTSDRAMPNTKGAPWRLLLDLDRPSRQHAVERIMGAVKELGLPPSQAGRIEQATTEALEEAARSSGSDCPDPSVILRVWTSEASTGSTEPLAPPALEAGHRKDRGWGFFVVKRQKHGLPAFAGQSRHLVDLFVYRKR